MTNLLYTLGYQVDLPGPTSNIQSSGVITSSTSNPYYEILFKILTTYLWIFTGVTSFIVVLFAGYNLLVSTGIPEDLKKANKTLVWGLLGIFVSLLSYTFIKLLIKLF